MGWASDRLTALPKEGVIGSPPTNWELGTRDAGSYATFSDVVDYFVWLGGRVTKSSDRRARIESAAKAIHDHEQQLGHAMMHGTGNLRGLAELPGVTIIAGADNAGREGVVSLTLDHMESVELVSFLNARGVRTHARMDDHYCGNVLRPLGLKSCVRVSFSHYNTEQEVAQFLTAMNEASTLAESR